MDARILNELQAASQRVKSILDESDRILDALKMRNLKEPEDDSAQVQGEAMEVDHEGPSETKESEEQADDDDTYEAEDEAEDEASDETHDEANAQMNNSEPDATYSDSDSDVEHCCGFICRRNY